MRWVRAVLKDSCKCSREHSCLWTNSFALQEPWWSPIFLKKPRRKASDLLESCWSCHFILHWHVNLLNLEESEEHKIGKTGLTFRYYLTADEAIISKKIARERLETWLLSVCSLSVLWLKDWEGSHHVFVCAKSCVIFFRKIESSIPCEINVEVSLQIESEATANDNLITFHFSQGIFLSNSKSSGILIKPSWSHQGRRTRCASIPWFLDFQTWTKTFSLSTFWTNFDEKMCRNLMK